MKKINMFLRNQPPGRMIVAGFAAVILLGMLVLLLPISVKDGAEVTLIDALFTSTSAVCVTGLIAIDTADHFTAFGQGVVAALIQVGGLGVTSLGVGLMLVARKRVGIKSRMMVKEALNIESYKGIVKLVKSVLLMTLCFEAGGALLSFLVFSRDYSTVHAIGISIFHSIAAFNNSGFDILGGLRNLTPYQDDVLIVTSLVLLVVGTLTLKLTENVTWLGAFFQSVSARTAGFSTYPIGQFTDAGLFVLCILMFIGASPGSTGGGIKTSTFFIMFQKIRGTCTKGTVHAFHRNISEQNISKAFMITILSGTVVCVATFFMCVLEPEYSFMQLLFEVVSAFGTVGLSTGITPALSVAGKAVIILVMFTGRVGAFTLISMWVNRTEPRARYSEEVSIG